MLYLQHLLGTLCTVTKILRSALETHAETNMRLHVKRPLLSPDFNQKANVSKYCSKTIRHTRQKLVNNKKYTYIVLTSTNGI
jgi:hypothetical protein